MIPTELKITLTYIRMYLQEEDGFLTQLPHGNYYAHERMHALILNNAILSNISMTVYACTLTYNTYEDPFILLHLMHSVNIG